ncbi:MAG: NADPH-dependent FMN reductase [Vicinamibacteraceae bacterium]
MASHLDDGDEHIGDAGSGGREVSGSLRVLTVSGSLRARSSNGAVLDAVAALLPPHVHVTRYDALADLPAFNPDLDGEGATPPPAVAHWRAAIADADAVIICSPEYAHGVPGSLKNALDWLVSGPDVPGLPIAVVNATTRAHHAHESLIETLRTMSATVVEAASVRLPLAPSQRTAEAILADPPIAAMLTVGLAALLAAVQARK